MTLTRKKISAFIICQDEEKNIRRCLESIKWCDEIVIIDSGSKDETLSICREYHGQVLERAWPGFVEQKQFGLAQCSHEWVLNIDADEEVSPELAQELQQILEQDAKGQISADAFELSRVVFYLNKWWTKGGWYPEWRLRMMRKSSATWGGENPHERAIISGKVSRLKGELRHYTYSDISDHVRSLNTLSSVSAQSMFNRGLNSNFLSLLVNPVSRFTKFYFLKRGYREGFPGLIVALLEGYYVLLKYIKLWEVSHRARSSAQALPKPALPNPAELKLRSVD